MINQNLVERKIKLIQDDLEKLKKFKSYSFDEIAKDYYTHKTVERIIEVVINEAIDINQHLIVELGKGELPFDYKESFLLLTDFKILPKSFAQKIAQSVGLRNILVHQYRKLEEKIFYCSIKDCLSQYTRYCRYILNCLKKIN